jgi:uncharacterized phage protein (TIGR01671 family)
MKDRFKFRAWDRIKGTYIYDAEQVYDTPGIRADCFGYMLDDTYKGVYLVEQCTGLKDKNGKLVYEGDIVKTDSGKIYCIQWDKKTSSFREEDRNLSDVVYKAGHHLSLWADSYCKNYTVIGNIHENPELLED